jgi:hypothetical protein
MKGWISVFQEALLVFATVMGQVVAGGVTGDIEPPPLPPQAKSRDSGRASKARRITLQRG